MKEQKPKPKKRLRAIRDFICLHPEQPMRTSATGLIVIPEVADDDKNPPSGIVVSVGCGLVEGGQIVPLKVKVGQRVYFPRNAGTLIRNHPIIEDTFVIRENQIFGWDDDIQKGEAPAFKFDDATGVPSVKSGWDN